MARQSIDAHYDYPEVSRHWHPGSEKYASGDALMSFLSQGWMFEDEIEEQSFWHAGSRRVTIFHFTLQYGDVELVMPVHTNPYVRRLIETYNCSISEHKEVAAPDKQTKDD